MNSATTDIDYKAQLDEALLIIAANQLTIQKLQGEILQLKKLVFGSRHEKFISAGHCVPTLFDVAPIAEVVSTVTTTVCYEKKATQLQSNHHGRNSFPKNLRREEQVIYPEGIDMTTAK